MSNKNKIFNVRALLFLFSGILNAQLGSGLGYTAASAFLGLSSTTKGLRILRLNAFETDCIKRSAIGLIIFTLTLKSFETNPIALIEPIWVWTAGSNVSAGDAQSSSTLTLGAANATAGSNFSEVVGTTNTASGINSIELGGTTTLASGKNIFVVGGTTNTAVDINYEAIGCMTNNALAYNTSTLGGITKTALGVNSTIVGGTTNMVSGADTTVIGGTTNTALGNNSIVSGRINNTSKSDGERVGGICSPHYPATFSIAFVGTDKVFNIGNGIRSGASSDALTILKNGLATLPDGTNDLIEGYLSGKAITKEFTNANYTKFKNVAPA